jgi:hypothetical protein
MKITPENCGKIRGINLKKKMGDPKWRSFVLRLYCYQIRGPNACARCLGYRASKIQSQITEFSNEFNEVHQVTFNSEDEADKYVEKIKNRNKKLRARGEPTIKYKRYPVANGRFVFLTSIKIGEGSPLKEINEIDTKVLAQSPAGKNPSGSHGFHKLRGKNSLEDVIEGTLKMKFHERDEDKVKEAFQRSPGGSAISIVETEDPHWVLRYCFENDIHIDVSGNDEMQDYMSELEEEDLNIMFGVM